MNFWTGVRFSSHPPVEGLDTQSVLKSYVARKSAARPKSSDLGHQAPSVEGLDTQSVIKSCANLKLVARPTSSDLCVSAPPEKTFLFSQKGFFSYIRLWRVILLAQFLMLI